MKATIKDIKAQAKAIKESGAQGLKAWNRLETYLQDFDNVGEAWGETAVYIRGGYRTITTIIPSYYFFG